jgi:rhodanese-related sulfurtransferase
VNQPAGHISPDAAWAILEDDPSAVLVDVRTAAEWTYVGLPDLRGVGREVVRIEWNRLDGTRNPAFLDELERATGDHDAPVLFLCRSGVRSDAAAQAATSVGYARAHNVAGGFEGDLDPQRHRGTTEGWKASGLPWIQF